MRLPPETQEASLSTADTVLRVNCFDHRCNGSVLTRDDLYAAMAARRGDAAVTKRLPAEPAPGPLEDYAVRFDDLFATLAQRQAFRRYLEGLLLPAERNKTLTALANTEPVVGAQRKEAQSLQWFLSESRWDPREVNERRLELLFKESATAPNGKGVLVIDEHGDRKWGKKTAHVGKQWLAN